MRLRNTVFTGERLKTLRLAVNVLALTDLWPPDPLLAQSTVFTAQCDLQNILSQTTGDSDILQVAFDQ